MLNRDADYRIRLHRSRGDSGEGEAERTNSAIGDSVVDGAMYVCMYHLPHNQADLISIMVPLEVLDKPLGAARSPPLKQ